MSSRKHWMFLLFAAFISLVACEEKILPETVIGNAAKNYYDYLINKHFDKFADGFYQPESIPSSYRKQLILNAEMFYHQQQADHKGIKRVTVSSVEADTARHVADVFLILHYGNGKSEQVVVPMEEHHNKWYMH